MKKINIAIVDSNLMQRTITCEMIRTHLRGRPLCARVQEFDSGLELMKEISRKGRYDIYIMEVSMPEMNGISLGEELRIEGDRGIIIYLSKDTKDAYQAFKVKARDYILKPQLEERLNEALDEIIYELMYTNPSPVIEIKFKTGLMRVPINSITYVDVVDRALCFHMENGRELRGNCIRGTFKEAIEEIMGLLPVLSGFAIAGSTQLLNLSYILELGKGIVHLKTGEEIYIPRSAEKGLLEAWRDYMF